jgi:STE24 endopeptidase
MIREGIKDSTLQRPGRAKIYNRTKLLLGIASFVVSFAFIVIILVTGMSQSVERWLSELTSSRYLILLLFAIVVGAAQSVLTVPIGFVSGFVLEHQYGLSNQSFARWTWQHVKGLFVSLPLIVAALLLLFYCLNTFGNLWWIPVSVALTIFSILLLRLAPVLIFPLFYRFTPLAEGSLRERIIRLCDSAGVPFRGIFTFDLSKNTKKANAGFTGIGKSKRIILGDTLLREFSEEEIETVFAHELGHYTYHHLVIGMAVGTLSTFLGLFLAARLYTWSLDLFGFSAITEIAALPLLTLWLSLFGLFTSPLGNIISRYHERQADQYAVERTHNAPAFVSALRKLTAMNLSDPEPHPLVEFLFYSHPSISRRIRTVEHFNRQ